MEWKDRSGWRELRDAGLSYKAIGRQAGVARTTVSRYLNRSSTPHREPSRVKRYACSVWHEAAISLKAKGYSLTEIGMMLQQSPETVRMALFVRKRKGDAREATGDNPYG